MLLCYIYGLFFIIVPLRSQGNALNMYFEAVNTKTWYDAYADCLARGMELAILNSLDDYNAAKTYINTRVGSGNDNDVWIGYKIKDVSNGVFEWINGEQASFEKWSKYDPDYLAPDSCVRIKQSMQYKFCDIACSEKYLYLCTGGSAPVISNNINSISVTLGSSVSIQCQFTSQWDVHVQWIKETSNGDVIITPDEEPILYNVKLSFTSGQLSDTRLTFKSVSETDVGAYKCRVSNSFGVGTSAQISVTRRRVYFYENNKAKSWRESISECQNIDMELAVLNSYEDHRDAIEFIVNSGLNGEDLCLTPLSTIFQQYVSFIGGGNIFVVRYHNIWIGLYTDANTQNYTWINGIPSSYFDWVSGYPRAIGSANTCVHLSISQGYKFENNNCLVNFNFLCTEGSVPTVHNTQTTIDAMTFSNVSLECPYTSLWPITNVKWQKKTANGTTCILNDSKDTNVYGGGTISHPELVVYNMQTDREGTYRCFVLNKFGIGSGNDISLNILSGPPVIEPTVTVFHIDESDSVTFSCNAVASPPIHLETWSKDGVKPYLYSGPIISNYTITNAGIKDSGIYRCRVTNAEGSTIKTFTLTVNEVGSAPIVNTTQTNITSPLGSQVLLDCPYSSQCNITDVSWQKIIVNGTFIIKHPLDTTIYSGSTVQNSSLLIKSLKIEDEGRYACVVQNKFGVGRGNEISLNIQPEPPTIDSTTTTFEVNISDTVTFRCEATAYPTVTDLVWEKVKDGVTTQINTSQMTSNLTLSNIVTEDSGTYRCKVTNAAGTTILEFILDVISDYLTCQCSCDYKKRLDYWASITSDNYTLAELKEVLTPVTEQLRRELLVDTKILSATINKRVSQNDDRTSSKQLGFAGIAFLSLLLVAIVLIDLTSLPNHVLTVKELHRN